MIEAFELEEINADWHDTFTVKLIELVQEGFDPFGDEDYKLIPWYSDEVRERWEKKFKLHYAFYELGITPPLVWRKMFTAKLLDVMPKYNYLYKMVADGVNIMQDSDEFGKRRDVFSDFPATQLSEKNQDYASNATDNQWETINLGNFFDQVKKFKSYDDVDVMLLKECEVLFSCLVGVTAPMW